MWAIFSNAADLRVRVEENPLTVEGAPPELEAALLRIFSEPITAIEGWFDRFEGQWADREVTRQPGEPKHFDSVIDRAQRELGLRLVERGGWKRDPDAPPVPS
ncbi:MAG: hypothetical protein WAT58_00460 [Candidatus Dormiibacterota bacterium]